MISGPTPFYYMSIDDHQLLLQNLARHIQLDQAELDFFLSLLHHRSVKRREYLLTQGEVCRYESFVLKGCLRAYTLDRNGLEHILLFAMEEWWVGDFASFLTQSPAHLFIDALEDTELLQISKGDLDKLYERVPKFERFFRIILQNAYVAQQNRIHQSLSFTAEQRYLDLIRKYPLLEQRVSQKQIASYLGITPVFLSMIRRRQTEK